MCLMKYHGFQAFRLEHGSTRAGVPCFCFLRRGVLKCKSAENLGFRATLHRLLEGRALLSVSECFAYAGALLCNARNRKLV